MASSAVGEPMRTRRSDGPDADFRGVACLARVWCLRAVAPRCLAWPACPAWLGGAWDGRRAGSGCPDSAAGVCAAVRGDGELAEGRCVMPPACLAARGEVKGVGKAVDKSGEIHKVMKVLLDRIARKRY